MRVVFILSFCLNLMLTVASLVLCPSRVAINFGAGGDPNGWAPAYVNALIMTGVNVLIFASFFFTPQLLRIMPHRWINLPNKQYWLREENRTKLESILAAQMYQFGILTFAFFFMVGLLSLQANLSDPVRFREDLFLWPFGIFITYTIYWTIRMMLAFRLPKEERRQRA
jgi:hypothetical protein